MFADVLDAMGMTPREFAGVHVHFESVQRVDGPRFVASLLFQAAYEPVPRVKLVITHALSQRVVESREVPSLEDGRVVRMRLPLKLQGGEEPLLAVRLVGPEPRGRRVRTAWKIPQTPSDEPQSFFSSFTRSAPSRIDPAMRGPVLEGTAPPQHEPLLELLWRPGQRVPEKPLPKLKVVPAQGPVRWCRQCGFEGPRAEYERARECPQCGEPWL